MTEPTTIVVRRTWTTPNGVRRYEEAILAGVPDVIRGKDMMTLATTRIAQLVAELVEAIDDHATECDEHEVDRLPYVQRNAGTILR